MPPRKKQPAAEPPRDLTLDLPSIRRLVALAVQQGLSELEIEAGENRRVRIVRGSPAAAPQAQAPLAPAPQAATPPAAPEAPAPQEEPSAETEGDVVEFTSPLVGTFYRAPSPDSNPYVRPGDIVDTDTVLCIIEAMKVMNEIKAGMKGEILDVLVDNGEAVEFGQPLFRIRRLS